MYLHLVNQGPQLHIECKGQSNQTGRMPWLTTDFAGNIGNSVLVCFVTRSLIIRLSGARISLLPSLSQPKAKVRKFKTHKKSIKTIWIHNNVFYHLNSTMLYLSIVYIYWFIMVDYHNKLLHHNLRSTLTLRKHCNSVASLQ